MRLCHDYTKISNLYECVNITMLFLLSLEQIFALLRRKPNIYWLVPQNGANNTICSE